jgi:hypothetical protein
MQEFYNQVLNSYLAAKIIKKQSPIGELKY